MTVITLTYHDIVGNAGYWSSGFQSADANVYKIDSVEFERHLDAIGRVSQCRVATITDPGLTDSEHWVLLTFDDGGAGALNAATTLERRGWRGHFFITTDYIGQAAFLSAEQIRELYARGHVIGSHSCSHPVRFSKCAVEQQRREWLESISVLSRILGETVDVASVPGGYYAHSVAEIAAATGIRVLFNSEPTTSQNEINGCRVLGRYSVQRGISAATVGAIAAGAVGPRSRQWVYWNLKKALKSIGGEYWLKARRAILARNS